jgi:hypothetical protein
LNKAAIRPIGHESILLHRFLTALLFLLLLGLLLSVSLHLNLQLRVIVLPLLVVVIRTHPILKVRGLPEGDKKA